MQEVDPLIHAMFSSLPAEQTSEADTTAEKSATQSTVRNTNASHPSNTKQRPGSVPNSEDDIPIMDVPLEQYKPRPSRSRSLKLDLEEPINYSQRPERVAKKTRRTRTTGDVDTTSTATTPEKVRQICDMGFTPSTTRKGKVFQGFSMICSFDNGI